MPKKAGRKGSAVSAYSKADAFGGSKYEVSHIVGKGAYGVVWAGRTRGATLKKVAIKHIDRVFDAREDALRIVRELRFLRLLKHANVVAVEDVLLPRNPKSFNDIHIVFELFDTDLNHMIRSETRYDMTHRRWVLYQILQGLKHMHSVNVYHRDLKPGNILINANCDCKICDFGMARAKRPGAPEEDETVALWTDYVASRWYRAPELVCCYLTRYTAAIDIWSVGCIAAELLLRKALFPGKNGEAQLELITDLLGRPSQQDMQELRSARVRELLRSTRSKQPTPFRDVFPPEADDQELVLLAEMLRFSASNRMSSHDAVENEYFQEIRDLPAAQIPYVNTPELDPDDFIYDNAKNLSTQDLRATMYAEVETYHPQSRYGGLEPRSSGDEAEDDDGPPGQDAPPPGKSKKPGFRSKKAATTAKDSAASAAAAAAAASAGKEEQQQVDAPQIFEAEHGSGGGDGAERLSAE